MSLEINYQRSFILSLLASYLAFMGVSAGRADAIETITSQTMTTSTDAATINLLANGSYKVVDPITGRFVGRCDSIGKLDDGRPLDSGIVIVDKTNGALLATVDLKGNIVDIAKTPANQALIDSIDARLQDLNFGIKKALNKGQLSAARASAMQKDLIRIASDEKAARQIVGAFSCKKALLLGYELNTLSHRLLLITRSVPFEPVVSRQFVSIEGKLVMVDGITSRKMEIQRRIGDEYSVGQLSAKQVSRRKEDLAKISSLEELYRENGLLSYQNDRKLSKKLDTIQTLIDDNIAFCKSKRSKIGLPVD